MVKIPAPAYVSGVKKMVKKGSTNSHLVALIALLEKAAKKNKAPIWKRIAVLLSRPTRRRAEVSLVKISKFEGTVIVPGKVLSTGNGSKVTVAALSFSGKAREKLIKAGGKAISIPQLLESNPSGKNVLILI